MIAGEHKLTVSIAATLPVLLSRLRIDAREYRLVEPVDVSVVQHRAGELVFHPLVFPDRLRLKALVPPGPDEVEGVSSNTAAP